MSVESKDQMNIRNILNRITHKIEYLLVFLILVLYSFGIYTACLTFPSVKSFVSLYFICTSAILYLILLKKSPGLSLDNNNSYICGICTSCNKVRASRTSHCHICGKCYSRREYHLSLIGKCITFENRREVFLCLLFLFLFIISLPIGWSTFIFSFILLIPICWIGFSAVREKEPNKRVDGPFNSELANKAYKFVTEDPIGTLFPITRLSSRID